MIWVCVLFQPHFLSYSPNIPIPSSSSLTVLSQCCAFIYLTSFTCLDDTPSRFMKCTQEVTSSSRKPSSTHQWFRQVPSYAEQPTPLQMTHDYLLTCLSLTSSPSPKVGLISLRVKGYYVSSQYAHHSAQYLV